MAITKPTVNGIDDQMLNQLLREGHAGVRREGPTAEHPFGRTEFIPSAGFGDPLANPSIIDRVLDHQEVERTRGNMNRAIDHGQLEQARRDMMDQRQRHTAVRGMDTHARRDNRITDYEFRTELAHRLERSHPLLLNWAMGESDSENVDLWEIIVVCAIDQMLHGTPSEEPTQIDKINEELRKLEEEKNGTSMAKRRTTEDELLPF